MSAGLTARLISMEEAGKIREEILEQMPDDVRARAAACMRKEKAFQIAAADHYMRRMAEEEGLGTAASIRIGHEQSGKPFESPVGCDLERIRRLPMNGVLKGFFSEEDLAAIRASGRPDVLLTRIWTRREAFAKLTGIMEGLRKWRFHDRQAAEQAYGVRFTEGQENDHLFCAAQS